MNEEVLQSEFGELLERSGQLPEVVVVLRASEETVVDRLFDKAVIQKEYDRMAAERAVVK